MLDVPHSGGARQARGTASHNITLLVIRDRPPTDWH